MKPTLRSAASFGFVGAIGYGVSLTVVTLLAPVAGHALAYIPAWLCAATWTYLANRRLTFGCRHPPSFREWGLWLASQACGGGVGWIVYTGLIGLGLPIAPALGAATLTGATLNFVMGRKATAEG